MTENEKQETTREFDSVVNMTPAALRKWLDTAESQSVGMSAEGDKVTGPGGNEAVGHAMGRRILELMAKNASVLDDEDHAAMRKVIGYVHRHMKQRPNGDITDTRWRKSLMNWGHDPAK